MINIDEINDLLNNGKPLISAERKKKFPKDNDDISLINYLLSKGISLTTIDKSMKEFPSQKTLRGRWEQLGFKYDDEVKQLVLVQRITLSNTEVTPKKESSNTNITLNDTKVISDNTKATLSDSSYNIKVLPSVTTHKNNSNTKVTHGNIEDIVKRLEALENAVFNNNVLQNNINVTPLEIESRTDIITRSIKVSEDVMKQFTELCETKFPLYKKQDIITTILLDFIDKYK